MCTPHFIRHVFSSWRFVVEVILAGNPSLFLSFFLHLWLDGRDGDLRIWSTLTIGTIFFGGISILCNLRRMFQFVSLLSGSSFGEFFLFCLFLPLATCMGVSVILLSPSSDHPSFCFSRTIAATRKMIRRTIGTGPLSTLFVPDPFFSGARTTCRRSCDTMICETTGSPWVGDPGGGEPIFR